MRNKIRAALTAIVSFAIVAMAADGDSCTGKENPKGEKLVKELGLSQQQKAQLKSMREEMRGVHKEQMEKMKALLDKSKEELLKPAPNKEVLYGYARESGDLRRVMAEKEADHLLKVKAVLTPEQFKKLLSKDFGRRMGPDHGGPHGGPHEKGPHGEMD